jgi:hypothetical protein
MSLTHGFKLKEHVLNDADVQGLLAFINNHPFIMRFLQSEWVRVDKAMEELLVRGHLDTFFNNIITIL